MTKEIKLPTYEDGTPVILEGTMYSLQQKVEADE